MLGAWARARENAAVRALLKIAHPRGIARAAAACKAKARCALGCAAMRARSAVPVGVGTGEWGGRCTCRRGPGGGAPRRWARGLGTETTARLTG